MNQENRRVVWGGIAALVLTVGIARFAYTPLLPLMQAGVPTFSDAVGGLLAASNYLGYLSGAVLASLLHDIHLKDRLFRRGLLIALFTTLAMAWTTEPWLWALLRFFAGLAASAGLVLCSGLVMHALLRHGERPRMGLYFGGVGLGLAVAGIAVAVQSLWLDWQAQHAGCRRRPGGRARRLVLPAHRRPPRTGGRCACCSSPISAPASATW